MRWHVLCLIFLAQFSFGSSFVFPTGLSDDDIPKIVQSFNSGFITREPVTLLDQDKYATQVAARLNTIETDKVAKLGNKSKRHDIQLAEIAFSKKIPYNVELGLQTSMAFFDRDVRSIGGFVRWGFEQTEIGNLSLLLHGSSGNYKNLIGTNIYGILLGFQTPIWLLNFTAGIGAVRTTNVFDASLFVSGSELEDKTYGHTFSHESLKAAYEWNSLSISAQADWIHDIFTSVEIGYLF